MKRLLTFLTLLTLFFTTGWAESVTVMFTPGTDVGATSVKKNGVTVTMTTMNNSDYYQIYADGSATFSCENGNITAIEFSCTANGTNKYGPGNITANVGSYSYNAARGEWTGSANSVILSASKQVRMESLSVTYETSGGSSTTSYNLTDDSSNGSVEFTVGGNTVTSAEAGATVTATATAASGYEFDSWVQPSNVTNWSASGNTATFTMPTADVTVSATFTQQSITPISNAMIVFGDNGSDATNDVTSATLLEYTIEGASYVSSYSDISKVYKAITGIKFSSSSVNGNLTINLNSIAQQPLSKIIVNAKKYSNDNASLTVDGTSTGSLTAEYADYEITCDGTAKTSITLEATKRLYVKYINLVFVEQGDLTVTCDNDNIEHGSIAASPATANANANITITATPDPGYELSTVTVTPETGTAFQATVTGNTATFTMPSSNVTVTATFNKVDYTLIRSSNDLSMGDVKITDASGNELGTQPTTAQMGDVVYFKPTSQWGYQLASVTVTNTTANATITTSGPDDNGVYSFTMPAGNVTIAANFSIYRGTLRLAGHFNGNSSWRTGTDGPAFIYDTATDKYTISAYFTGIDDGGANDYFCLTLDGVEKHPQADQGNYYIYNLDGTAMPFNLSGGSNNNFGCAPGVYNIEINGALTSMSFTKQEPNLTFNPAAGEVEQGTSVSATSNLTTLIGNIKANDSGAAGEVTVGVNTDNGNTWNASETLNTIGSAIIYGKAYISNISVTGQANYNIVAENTNTQYQLINSTDDLVAGKRYIIVSTGSYTASGTTYNFTKAATVPNANNNLILDEDVTISSDIVDLSSNSNVTEFILGGTTDAWTFAFGDGTYLASTAAKSACASNTATPASISFSGDNATIYMNSTVGNFQYNPNNGNGRFAAYTSTQKPVMLFKQVEGTITQKSAAPEILPEGGNIVGFSQELTMTQDNGGTIHYTMTVGDQPNVEPADPADPTEASTQYDPENKPWAEVEGLGYIVKIKAVAKEVGKELSNPVSVRYLFVAPATPNFTPGANTYTTPQTVSLSTTTANADIYYTTNSELEASQFVTQGTKFEEPFTVSETTTYYAVAVYHDTHANKDAISGIRQAAYEIEAVPTVRPNYTESLTGGKGKFSVENEEGTTIDVWTQDAQWGMKGTSYVNNINYKATSWLLSPNIDLTDAVTPVLSFDHQINKYFNNPSTQATLWVSVDGGDWEPIGIGLPSSKVNDWTSYEFSESISAYNGHIVRFGFKYNNPTAGTGAGTWEIQNFSVTDENIPPIEVNNIAEFMDNTIVPEGSKAKLLNPVVVLYHYQQYHNEDEGDYVNDYIWVKDESGYAIIYGKYLDVNYTNGDIIPAGFTATKFYYNVGRFYQMYYPEGLQAATQKTLADPEPVTLKILNDNKNDYNGHYVTIPKMQIKFSSGELVSYTYNFETEDSYGGQRNFEIGDASLSLTSNNKSIIGYNNFDNPWLETLDYPEFENTTEVYGDYNITGIFERYNNNWEFMPIIITPWEEQTMTLHDLCEKGVEQQTYTISNPLQVVYVDTDNNSVWVKDDNGQSIWKTSPEAPNSNNFAIDYPDNTRSEQKYYDQSNWCQLKFDGEIPSSFAHGPIINGRKINGTFTNKLNPTLENVTIVNNDIDLVMAPEASYDPNYYVAANFSGPQLGYFFMNPKPQEYAHIVWAIYDETNNAMIMPSNTSQNPNEFTGSFKVNMSMNSTSIDLVDGTETGKGYEHFTAIIRLMSTTSGAPMLKGAPTGTEYVVFPLDITQEDVPTAINDLFTGNGEVKSVKFYNVAGIESNVPFQGVNIVVTEYTDGSRTTTKMLKR